MKYKPQRNNVRSSRELRRIAEREQQKERNKRAIEAFWNLSPEERQRRIEDDKTLSRIQRNGITIDDLDRAGQEGYAEGNRVGAENTMKIVYAAIALVLRDKLKYGIKRCKDFLNEVDQKVIYALDSREAVQAVYDEMGLQLKFSGDTFEDRVQEKEGD